MSLDRLGLLAAAGAFALAVVARAQAVAPVEVAEQVGVARLAPDMPHRVYGHDTAALATQAGRTWVVDGDKGAVEGVFYQGHLSNFALAPDGRELYSADTYYDRHSSVLDDAATPRRPAWPAPGRPLATAALATGWRATPPALLSSIDTPAIGRTSTGPCPLAATEAPGEHERASRARPRGIEGSP